MYTTQDQQFRDSLHLVAKNEAVVHSTIVDYLKEEDIRKVQIIETRKSDRVQNSQDFALNVQQ